MISRREFCISLAGLGALVASPLAAQPSWRTYRNPRFGTSIEYPGDFRPGRPPENGAGLGFTRDDGASFSIWGSHNALDHDIGGLEAFVREGRQQISYDQRGPNWFVISGLSGNAIFYERHLLSHGGRIVNGFAIRYPSSQRADYDAIVARMSRSFRAGQGDDTDGNP